MWSFALIAYLFIGLVFVLTAPIRRKILNTLTDDEKASQPIWKAFVFHAIVFTGSISLWPIFLPGWLRKDRTAWDELLQNPGLRKLRTVFDVMTTLSEDGCDTNEIPGAHGEFGHDLTNPIPTKTVLGSTSYLGKLRLPNGSKVTYERIGSFSSPISTHPVDGYEISHLDGTPLAVIYLSPYHLRNSEKAPDGLILRAVTSASD